MFLNLVKSPPKVPSSSVASPKRGGLDEARPELRAATRMTEEIRLSVRQVAQSLEEVQALAVTLPRSSTRFEGLFQLRDNLALLVSKLKQVQTWHAELHRSDHALSINNVLFAEISLLLLFPYLHRLLSRAEREPTTPPWTPDLLPAEDRRSSLHYKHIDPTYTTKYDGPTLASILMAVERNRAWSCFPSSQPSARQCGEAKVLATKFFGIILCIDMIIDPVVTEEHDLILERAVGQPCELEVPGVQTTACLYHRRDAEAHLRNFTSKILMANAIVERGFYQTSRLAMALHWAAAGCWLAQPCNRVEAEHRGDLCYTGTREEIKEKLFFAQFVWNLPETALVRNFYKLGLPSIKVDYEFFVPPSPVAMEGGEEPVKARVVSNRRLARLPDTPTRAKALCFDWQSRQVNSAGRTLLPGLQASAGAAGGLCRNADVLMVHFHGGGFISMSSFSHENYTRHWARDVGLNVVSADYRLAPAHKFPVPFNDAYRTYRYCLDAATEQLGFEPRKIILAGDSAGGNLACSVAVQAITDGIRVPDGLLLCYPVVDMRRRFWPSLLWTVNDRIVPFVFLECCMAAYLHPDPKLASDMAHDPRCSPALAPEWVLRKMPKTRIVCGDRDPLYDQAVRFANQLARLDVDVGLKIYEGMPHGFLSFLWPVVGVPEVKACVDDCSEILREMCL